MDIPELTVRAARELLIEYAAVVSDRDTRVRIAYAAGVPKIEIHRITGLARQTVDNILSDNSKSAEKTVRNHCCTHPGTGICMCDCHDRGCDCYLMDTKMREA